MRVGPITIQWRRAKPDPYWDFFINASPTDPNNLVAAGVRRLPEGNVFPTKTDIHSPLIMSGHVKEFARFLGADFCGVAKLPDSAETVDYPFGVVCAFRTDRDPRLAVGIGGQTPMLKGAFVTFVLGAWIRECGYRATRLDAPDAEALAVQAGVGRINAEGRLISLRSSSLLYVADVLYTDLPLVADAVTFS